MGGERRREKSLRIGVHHANAVVWEPVYGTHLDANRNVYEFVNVSIRVQVRPIHWFPYDRVRVVNADP